MKYLIIIFTFLLCNCTSDYQENKQVTVEPDIISDSLLNYYDSLMYSKVVLPQLIDSSHFSIDCVNQFEELARSTDGELKIAIDPDQLIIRISEVIDENISHNTDVLIIIDRTNSMRDDLKSLKNGLEQLIFQLKKYRNVNIAIATYGDKQNSFFPWYSFKSFDNNFEDAINYVKALKVYSGIDTPESVYDAIMMTKKEDFWSSKGERIAILLGDAPSHDSTKTKYSINHVLDYASSRNVKMNIYPIVLSPKRREIINKDGPVMQKKRLIESIYPNPTKGISSVKLTTEKLQAIEIFDQTGKKIKESTLKDSRYRLNLTNLQPGVYLIRVYDHNKNFDVKRVIKN